MKLENISFATNLFSKQETGRVYKYDASPARGYRFPFLVIYPDSIEEERPLLVIKDDTLSDLESDISKEKNLALTSLHAVLVPITNGTEIDAISLDNMVMYAREQIYGYGDLIADGVILIDFELELPNEQVIASLPDEGLEVLTRNIDNVENSVPKM